ncbi:hypothetical protein DIPPA_01182 [Diplonema papillatum]|nr:hypothetical protein DIPPA_01182 [Diplonema papillatum]
MAHLSDVTHQRLDQRRVWGEDVLTTQHQGVRNVSGFDGYIRCVEVVQTPGAYDGSAAVWTGDQDGEISVRRANGRILFSIERKKDVFVTSMLSIGGFMWCGLSDGYLRIFDEETYALAFEVKQHSGAITCMTYLNGCVYTGSLDWQVLQWDASEFRYMVQLSGHQNAVLCLASEGNTLFSGGDDYYIRCWNLDTLQERGHPWPIIGHRGGVKALQVHEVFLYSASIDGTMKVWNTQTGHLVKFLDHRDGPITSLMKDPCSDRIWAGGVDGVIAIWDTTTLQLVTRMLDHAGTYVNSLHVLIRLSEMKAWSVAQNGSVKVWNSESDPQGNPQHQVAVLRQQQELQFTVENMRATVIHNYEELERNKDQLRLLEDIDAARRANLAVALGRKSHDALSRAYYHHVMRWIAKRRDERKRREIAQTLLKNTERGLLYTYYSKFYAFHCETKEARRKICVAEVLSVVSVNGLQKLYWKKLQEYARSWAVLQKREQLAAALGSNTRTGLACVFYQTWYRWFLRKRELDRRSRVAEAHLRCTHRGLITLYWNKIEDFVKRERQAANRAQVSDSFMARTDKGVLSAYYTKLTKFLKFRQSVHHRNKHAVFLARATTNGLLTIYFRRLLQWSIIRREQSLERELGRIQRSNDELRQILSSKDMTDEEILAAMDAADEEIARLNEDTQNELGKLAAVNAQLADAKRRSNKARLGLKSTKEREMHDEVMMMLKAKAIHCLYDFERVTLSREEGKMKEHQLYESGLRAVKRVIEKENAKLHISRADTFPPDGVWRAQESPDTGMTILPRKALRTAAQGIRDMILAYDMMTFEKKNKLSHNAEVIANGITLLDIVMSLHKVRRKGDEDLERSPQGSGRRGSSRSKRKSPVSSGPSSKSRSRSKSKRPSKKKSSSKSAKQVVRRSTSSVRSKKRSSSKKKVSRPKVPRLATGGLSRRSPSPRPRTSTRLGMRSSPSPRPRASSSALTPRAGKRRVSKKRTSSKKKKKPSSKKRASSSLSPKKKRTSSKKRVSSKKKKRKVSGKRLSSKKKKRTSSKKKKRSSKKRRVSMKRAGSRPPTATSSRLYTPRTHTPRLSAMATPRSTMPTPRGPGTPRSGRAGTPRAGAVKRDEAKLPWLGMQVDIIDDTVCRIDGVVPGGPAEAAGLMDNDILVSFNHEPVTTVGSFQAAFKRSAKVGQQVAFGAIRSPSNAEISGVFVVKSQADKKKVVTI